MNLTRRELLTAFLGAPLAYAACNSGREQKFPDGQIVGQSVSLGHILRENRSFEVPADKWETRKVAIIGGGIAGLSAAWKLKKENFSDFVLLELEKEVGGTSASGHGDPVGYPWAAHYFQQYRDTGRLGAGRTASAAGGVALRQHIYGGADMAEY